MSKELIKVLKGVERKNSGVVVSLEASSQPKGENAFMGLGILSGIHLSEGLGLSALPMFCMIAQIQDHLPESIAHILIADSHASDQLTRENSQISELSDFVLSISRIIIRELGANANIFKASTNASFQFNTTGSKNRAEYGSRQNHDVLVAHEELDCGVKIGWQSKRGGIFGGKLINVRDEKAFDRDVMKAHPKQLKGLSFLRTIEGLKASLNGKNNPIQPYFGTKGVTLGRSINIEELSGETREMKNHLSKIRNNLKTTLGIKQKTKSDILQDFVDALT